MKFLQKYRCVVCNRLTWNTLVWHRFDNYRLAACEKHYRQVSDEVVAELVDLSCILFYSHITITR